MKKIATILVLFISMIYAQKIQFSIGSANSKVMDVNFEFSEEGEGIISLSIDQISSKGSDVFFMVEEPKNSYVAFLKWLIKLTSAEMRGFQGSMKIYDQGVDISGSIERLYFEIKDIDIFADDRMDNVSLNSLNVKFSLTNLKFNIPFLNDRDADEALKTINKAIPDGKVGKMELAVNYSKQNNLLQITGLLRMLGGNANLDIALLIDENDADATYVNSASLKLKNLSDGMIEFIDTIEKETSIKVERIGRTSINLTYSGPIKNLPSGQYKQISYASEVKTAMSNIHNAAKMYYQTKGEWPSDVEQLERSGQLDLDRSTKLKWTIELSLPDRLSAVSTVEMPEGKGKIVIADLLTGQFYGYGSEEDESSYIGPYDNINDLGSSNIVCISTRFGDIKLRLFPDLAPMHVESFKTHVQNGYYNGTTFHRVIPGFMIQGGDPLTRSNDRSRHGTGGRAASYYGIGSEYDESTWDIPAEFSNRSHKRGTLSMARSKNPNSAGSQFFICVADAAQLDNQYTIFGEVLEGMNVADRIVNQSRDSRDNPNRRITLEIGLCK